MIIGKKLFRLSALGQTTQWVNDNWRHWLELGFDYEVAMFCEQVHVHVFADASHTLHSFLVRLA